MSGLGTASLVSGLNQNSTAAKKPPEPMPAIAPTRPEGRWSQACAAQAKSRNSTPTAKDHRALRRQLGSGSAGLMGCCQGDLTGRLPGRPRGCQGSFTGLLAADVFLAADMRHRQAVALQRFETGVDHVRVAAQVGDVACGIRR